MSDRTNDSATGRPGDDLVKLGVLTKPHGHRGAIKMFPDFDVLEDFERLPTDRLILLQPVTPIPAIKPAVSRLEVHVEGHFFHQRYVVLELREVPDMNHAEKLRGYTVHVPDAEMWTPAEGEYFVHELPGFELKDAESGSLLGVVTQIFPGSAHDYLEVKNAERKFLVPFSKAMVVAVDTALRQIRVNLPPGLDEL